ncbi:hypothetical protein EST38_g10426 [Candolleomyces aberdarensis]|uniref:DASH complex subunit DAD2 n=1 Tax=Candolleomyces aberdarensis TaxID=2316362 RepID=A0A4Q2D7E4_9AGAR|nr:hypothetical protein EST38_g10426 [Candolleomyces aberdarensis]
MPAIPGTDSEAEDGLQLTFKSMRPSIAASRASHLPSAAPSAAAAAKLIEKKKEFDAVSALERASALYLERISALADDCVVMADAGEAHGQVLAQWPRMFEILGQFLATRQQLEGDETQSDAPIGGERLVRLPIDELEKEAESKPS